MHSKILRLPGLSSNLTATFIRKFISFSSIYCSIPLNIGTFMAIMYINNPPMIHKAKTKTKYGIADFALNIFANPMLNTE